MGPGDFEIVIAAVWLLISGFFLWRGTSRRARRGEVDRWLAPYLRGSTDPGLRDYVDRDKAAMWRWVAAGNVVGLAAAVALSLLGPAALWSSTLLSSVLVGGTLAGLAVPTFRPVLPPPVAGPRVARSQLVAVSELVQPIGLTLMIISVVVQLGVGATNLIMASSARGVDRMQWAIVGTGTALVVAATVVVVVAALTLVRRPVRASSDTGIEVALGIRRDRIQRLVVMLLVMGNGSTSISFGFDFDPRSDQALILLSHQLRVYVGFPAMALMFAGFLLIVTMGSKSPSRGPGSVATQPAR